MTTPEQEPPNSLGYLAGRIEGQQIQIQDLKEGHQQLRTEMMAGFQELGRRLDAGLKEVRAAQRQILIANWTIGGVIIASLIGLAATLIIRGI